MGAQARAATEMWSSAYSVSVGTEPTTEVEDR
jgi:hypothetical protein